MFFAVSNLILATFVHKFRFRYYLHSRELPLDSRSFFSCGNGGIAEISTFAPIKNWLTVSVTNKKEGIDPLFDSLSSRKPGVLYISVEGGQGFLGPLRSLMYLKALSPNHRVLTTMPINIELFEIH
ncbi:hypothetical protein TNCT_532271 [Trichonephila clavata]|uniref:Uncharacterized protein n=1 Tax=Trichonephila clavata TaxID=2740835 RepID=A0A8X6JTZ8_TRICU|nr:hypothetical protein TNCT_532271 [Trichonephila clavata]